MSEQDELVWAICPSIREYSCSEDADPACKRCPETIETQGYGKGKQACRMAAETAAERVRTVLSAPTRAVAEEGWQPKLMKIMCGAGERCSCAVKNFQWRDRQCELIERHAEDIAAMLAAAPASPLHDDGWPDIERPAAALKWAAEMFGEIALEPRERAMRFVEEAVELVHAMGLDATTLQNISTRVYGRNHGYIPREIGQAQMTLEALAEAIGQNAQREAADEFKRVQAIPKSEWSRRHLAKVDIGIATLPPPPREP